MTIALQFAILGLGTGAIYALLGEGIVLIFRGSGVLNLAHGAFAMAGGFIYYQLHDQTAIPMAPAMLITVACVAAMGALTDRLALRRLRKASPLTRLIATLGVLLVLQSGAVLVWGPDTLIASNIFPGGIVKIFGAVSPVSAVWMIGTTVAITAALTLVWRYTRAGWATVAVSENQRAAAALGWSPDLISAATWAGGAALAGVAGILIAPVSQLNVEQLSFFIVPALAAALIGGFSSFPLTLLGGLFVGVTQSEAGWYVHITGASDALPFLLIVIVLIIRGSSLPQRGHIFDRLPEVGSGRVRLSVIVPAFIVVALVMSFVLGNQWPSALAVQFSIAIVLLSLVVVTGYAGQLSLAQFALGGIGALVGARLIATQGWPFILAVPAAVAAAALIGLMFALPALRTRGVNLAVVTLGLGVATQALIFNSTTISGSWSGNNIGQLHLFGWNIDFLNHPARYALVAMAAFALCGIAVANLRRGRSGRRLLAVRANERAASATGINVFVAKLHAFGIAGALAGLGGLLFAFQTRSVNLAAFDPVTSISLTAQAVIGGIGYVFGANAGATISPGALASLVGEHWASIDSYLPLAGGILLLVTIVANPSGIENNNARLAARLRKRFGREDAPPAIPLADSAPRERVKPHRLLIEDLTVRYGGVLAVDRFSMEVSPGEIVGLIGPNGAGKTTLMDAVTGFAPCTGRVELDGQPLGGWAAHRRARAGLVRSFQALELFEDMTALENLQAASDAQDSKAMVTDLVHPGRAELGPAAVAAVREFGLAEHLGKRPDELSYGQRRLVAIARAVSMEPSVLLLDEPASGLSGSESVEFATLVRRLADEWGMAVVVIEHDMDFVMQISDRVVVMDFGRKIAEGTPAEVRNNRAAIDAYLGAEPGGATADDGGPRPEVTMAGATHRG